MMATSTVNSAPMPPSPNGKRKRGQNDQGAGRGVKAQNTGGPVTPDFSFLHAIEELANGGDGTAQTAQAALAAPMSHSQYPDSFDASAQLPSYDDGTGQNNVANAMVGGNRDGPLPHPVQVLQNARREYAASKPAVGTTQWHQQRKNNHKEVERRRREVINEGIENIAKIVPGSEKNKGAILARTCVYIGELKAKEASFDNERRLFDATLSEITSRHDEARRNLELLKAESKKWQRRCRDAGLSFDDYDLDLDGHDIDATSAALVAAADGFDAADGHSA